MRGFLILVLCLHGAGACPQTTDSGIQPPPAVSAERKSMDLLAQFHDPQAVLWLEAQGEEFLALYRPALRGQAKGSVILLPAQGQHPAWPGPLNYLRQRLPELGWNTLSLSLPAPDQPTVTTPTPGGTQPPAEVLDETEEVFDPTTDSVGDGSVVPERESAAPEVELQSENQAVERIIAAVNHLKSQNQNIIVIYGQGLGSLRGGRYLQETGDNAIQALVFVDAQNAIGDDDFQLTRALTNPTLPVLDIVYSRAIDIELDAKQRQETAAMMELRAYQQHWFAEDNERLANMVYGFLRRHLGN